MTQWGLDTLFNPAKRHMDEEKRRLQSTREELGDSSGGKRIDLESGKVVIRKRETDDEQPEEAAADADGDAAGADSADGDEKSAVEKKPKRDMTPAAKRAAERRARLRK
jgi:hypothetical protein